MDNLCKGEVEAKNINKDYAPKRRMRRIVGNRSAGNCLVCCHSHELITRRAHALRTKGTAILAYFFAFSRTIIYISTAFFKLFASIVTRCDSHTETPQLRIVTGSSEGDGM